MSDRLQAIRAKQLAAGKRSGPVVPDDELTAFERRYGIAIPDGYRQFLAVVGNGGDGPPEYGLVPLGRAAVWQKWPDIRKPFPFREAWCWEDGSTSADGTQEQVDHGSLYLGTDGCGMDWVVVVTGPERGNVWMVCGEGIQPTTPRRDFLTWYDDWLDGTDDWFR